MPCRLDVNWSWSPVFVIEKGRKRLGWIYRYNMATHTYDTYVTHVYVYIYIYDFKFESDCIAISRL